MFVTASQITYVLEIIQVILGMKQRDSSLNWTNFKACAIILIIVEEHSESGYSGGFKLREALK